MSLQKEDEKLNKTVEVENGVSVDPVTKLKPDAIAKPRSELSKENADKKEKGNENTSKGESGNIWTTMVL